MTINVPFRLDIDKDSDIIDLLNKQTNRSAFIRLVLREYIGGFGFVKYTPPTHNIDDLDKACSDNIIDCIDNL